MLPAGIHLCLAVVLSEAKPTGCRLLHLSFPARESSILLRDDSSGNLGLGSLSVGIATLNPLNADYPLSGKGIGQLSEGSCQFSEGSDESDRSDLSDANRFALRGGCGRAFTRPYNGF